MSNQFWKYAESVGLVIFAAIVAWVVVTSVKRPVHKPIPHITTEERILGELTLIRKMMEKDREAVPIYLKEGRLPGVVR